MSKLIRRTVRKGGGAALVVALQLITLTLLSLMGPFAGGPQKQAPAVAGTDGAGAAQDQTQTAQAQTETAEPITAKDPTAADKSALRNSAHFGKKLYEPLNTQVFNLATSRAESAHNTELPNNATLTTDREDYQPFTYVY